MNMDLHEAHNEWEVEVETEGSMRSQNTIRRKKAKGSSKSGPRSEMKIKPKITSKLISNYSRLLFTSYFNMQENNFLWVFCCFYISRDQKVHQSALLGLPENTELFYKINGETLLTGWKRGNRIFCNCCNTEVSASKFEAHAGKSSRRKPYHNIYDSNGVSLHTYATEHIENRCIQIVDKASECDLVACVLCRAYDFTENGFDDRTAIICDQCEREYHVGCLRESSIANLEELPQGKWFCSADCMRLHSVLAMLVARGWMEVSDCYIDILRKKAMNSNANSVINRSDVKLIYLRCKDASEEHRSLLTEAIHIFHDCFNPITDSSTRKDFIKSMADGDQMGGWDFSGVHCALVTIDSKVVTAGMFRVLGQQLVELPLVATSRPYQGKGYLQLFLKCFEELLSYLNVEKLVIPAAADVKAMWTDKFGFVEVTPEQLSEYRQTWTAMVTFEGTTCLEKMVPKVSNPL